MSRADDWRHELDLLDTNQHSSSTADWYPSFLTLSPSSSSSDGNSNEPCQPDDGHIDNDHLDDDPFDRSHEGGPFGSPSQEDDLDPFDRSQAPSSPRPEEAVSNRRWPQQLYSTSFSSGFSDQMEIDEHGQERFRPGTEIWERWTRYKTEKKLAEEAKKRYNERKAELSMRRQHALQGPGIAHTSGGRRSGLGGDFSISEHRELRRLAHEVYRHKMAETLGREAFNEKYRTVWEKRHRQTGRDSVRSHEKAAAEARRNAYHWRDVQELHAEEVLKALGSGEDVSSLSSWGSSNGS